MVNFVYQIVDLLKVFLFLKVFKRIDRVESTTAYSDLQFLFLAARDGWGKGDIVEVGAYKGKSTVALALGSKAANRERIYSIDPHTEGTKDIYLANLRKLGVEDYVITKVATSDDASKSFNSTIRLIFIDANHEYEFVKNDILLWRDKLIDGGIIVFHDYNWESVAKAVDELIKNSPEFIIEGQIGCAIFASKKISRNKELFEKVFLFNRLKKSILRR